MGNLKFILKSNLILTDEPYLCSENAFTLLSNSVKASISKPQVAVITQVWRAIPGFFCL